VQYHSITTASQLEEYCRGLARANSVAFDTEFVSEHTYRPVLCLVQVAAAGEMAAIDAVALQDLTPFWEAIVTGEHETIVHAGRSEMEFCLRAFGRWPARLFDVQIAAGLVGLEYPAGYNTIVAKLLGQKAHKHETRTDWRHRPLTARQIEYAMDDVRHLPALRDRLHQELEALGRLAWFHDEMAAWKAEVEEAQSKDRWRRVSGISGLDARTLAIVRELFLWRESEADRRNKPVRRVLRDDLIVEIARRQTADAKHILGIRGLDRGDLRRHVAQIAACVERGLAMPEPECPAHVRGEQTTKMSVLGQFLFAALGSICREARLAPNLVGGPNDIRDLILYRLSEGTSDRRPPKLAQGWRAEFVGRLFDDLLAGNKAIRIGDPASDHPLVFETRSPDAG